MTEQTFREMPGFTTTDGHRYTSIPTDVPLIWERRTKDSLIWYGSGDYKIDREPYVGARSTYELSRYVDNRWVKLGIGGFSLLRDAQAHARKNARGEDVVNWA